MPSIFQVLKNDSDRRLPVCMHEGFYMLSNVQGK